MDTVEFNDLTKHIYNKVFESFEKYDPNLVEADYNLDSISICFGDGTRFVVNRQPPVKQLWLKGHKRQKIIILIITRKFSK